MKECPAWGKTCLSWRVRNHFARVCRKKNADVHAMTEQERKHEDDDDDEFEYMYITSVTFVQANVYSVNSLFANEIYAELIIAKQKIKFQIDCGATINILPERYVKDHNLKLTSK